jgi:hypothetical protein
MASDTELCMATQSTLGLAKFIAFRKIISWAFTDYYLVFFKNFSLDSLTL